MGDLMCSDKTGRPRPNEWWARRWLRYTRLLWRRLEAANADAGVEAWAKAHGWATVADETWTRWEKRFGHGTVRVGRGRAEWIVFSFGANSALSFSSTRILVKRDRIMSETEAMQRVETWWRSENKVF